MTLKMSSSKALCGDPLVMQNVSPQYHTDLLLRSSTTIKNQEFVGTEKSMLYTGD